MRRALGVAAVGACAALAGCLGSGDSGGPAPQAGPTLATPIRLTDCSNWRKASPSQRSAIIQGIRSFVGGPTGSPAGHGPVLDDDKAYNLFEVDCRETFAKRFKLYKLYARAAAFGER